MVPQGCVAGGVGVGVWGVGCVGMCVCVWGGGGGGGGGGVHFHCGWRSGAHRFYLQVPSLRVRRGGRVEIAGARIVALIMAIVCGMPTV